MFDLSTYLKNRKERVDAALEDILPTEDTKPEVLHRAMRYSVLGGGKRFRPILCLASTEAVGADAERAIIPAVAIELLHTYSLIHDDLPAMDNDNLRRGQPTCHVEFGEANAILAGDALLTLAFGLLARADINPASLVAELAEAGGSYGMIGGQVDDMRTEGQTPSAEEITSIQLRKTAALIRASTRMGGLAGGATESSLDVLTEYGAGIGLAFQIVDDVLNATSTAEMLGKPVGSDGERSKATAVRAYGIDGARDEAQTLAESAITRLSELSGPIEPLEALARFVIDRVS